MKKETNKEQFDKLKMILEPRPFYEVGTELPIQHFFDMDALTFGIFYKELFDTRINTATHKK